MKLSNIATIMLLAAGFPIAFASCGQSAPPAKARKTDGQVNHIQPPQPPKIDTAQTAIIPFEPGMGIPFDSACKPAAITQQEVDMAEQLLPKVVADYNSTMDKNYERDHIDLENTHYRKQLVAVLNAKGEKEIWVNCFCNIWGSDKWKTQIFMVDDGGKCYFNFKINTATGKAYAMQVNGVA